MKASVDASTDTSANSGKAALSSSKSLDDSLARTTKLTSFDSSVALDPETADSLIKESFAAAGSTLVHFHAAGWYP